MKASLAWINSYLDRSADAQEAHDRLGAVGFPVEGIEPIALAGGTRDTRLEVEITSNRGDCTNHLGLARELAAATGRALVRPSIDLPAEAGTPVAELTSVENREADLCPVYTARVITGVKVGPSPAWLVDRLEAIGLRSVNNVVDVTNFVLFEMGQPLHAFDLAKLAGRRIVVRRAAPGEKFTAIDGSKHELRDSMLVIADAEKAVAVAGVMGGLDSEVSSATVDVLLESARFDPLSIRRTSRALKLASDSSYRFERGVDPRGVELASRRAAQLIVELAGGTLAEGVIRVGEEEPAEREVSMRVERCHKLLGVDIDAKTQALLLERLGLRPKLIDGRITCTIPTYRRDLEREVDLIEEVARLHGMDDIPVRDRVSFTVQPRQPEVAARQVLHRVLVAHGYHETVTFSFLSPKQAKAFMGEEKGVEPVVLDDERRKAEPVLRPSIVPSLLNCRKLNQDAGNENVRLYEIASTWVRHEGEIVEKVKLALLADAADPHAAVRLLRGTLEESVERLGGRDAKSRLGFEPRPPECGVAADVRLGDRVIGAMGLLDAKVRDLFDVKANVVAAEVDLDPLLALYPPSRQVGSLPRFPAIERDVSWVVDETVEWRRVEEAVHATKPAMLERIDFLGTYRGKPIEKGRKSVSFRMLFRDPAGTLRHEQVDPQVAAVIESLREKVGGELRS